MSSRIFKLLLIVAVFIAGFGGYKLYNNKYLVQAREEVARLFRVYEVFDQNGPIKLTRHGRDFDGGYVVPEIAFAKADVLIGYGIAEDISFEERFSDIYNKPSYGFDCGVENIAIHNQLCHFTSECISSDDDLYGDQRSSGKSSSFDQQLRQFGLDNKQIFIKIDIEGGEYKAMPDILKHAKNITGIVMELHFSDKLQKMEKALNLLREIERDFILVHVHGNNYSKSSFVTDNAKGPVPTIIELSYINKSLVIESKIAADQTHPGALDMPNCPSHKEDWSFEIVG